MLLKGDILAGCAVLALLALAGGCRTTPPEAPRPNIALFLVDDLGWQDTSVPFYTERTPFNDRYRTPHMERLARQGMTFTNAYAASPVCTPTRTSIMTGRHPARTRITNWTLRNDLDAQETSPKAYPLRSPAWHVAGLQPGEVTLPEVLRRNGYRTIHVGKAHFGALGTPGADPTTLGFDVNVAGHAAGGPGSFYGRHNFSGAHRGADRVWDVPGLERYHGQNIYLTDALTREANRAIERAVAEGKPFFLNMAHYAVHAPIMADSQYVGRYEGLHPVEAAYASMIEGMDASLGAIMDKLEELGVAENTLILFMSDNGGLSAHARGGELHTHNAPLRSGKGSAYEGGIRVPMIVAWAKPNAGTPAQARLPIEAGRDTDEPVISDDFFPTILEVTGVEESASFTQDIDGRSLVPLLVQAGGFERGGPLHWHYPHKWGPEGPGLDPFTAIRDGDWKLIYFYHDRRWELYNLANDLGETTNLAERRPEITERLARNMVAWMEDVGAQAPVARATGQEVGLPVPSGD